MLLHLQMLIDYIRSLQIDKKLLIAEIKIQLTLYELPHMHSTYVILLYPFSMSLKHHFFCNWKVKFTAKKCSLLMCQSCKIVFQKQKKIMQDTC